MKKLLIAAVIALAGCSPAHKKVSKAFHLAPHNVYHFADGRVGYQDQNLIWYYLIMSNNNTTASVARTSYYNSPTIIGGWSVGKAPTQKEQEEANTQNQNVLENEAGTPSTVAEAAAVEASTPSIAAAEVSTDVSGDISAPVVISVQAEGETETATTTSPASESAPASDSGSSDSGSSGGDSGGSGGGGSE